MVIQESSKKKTNAFWNMITLYYRTFEGMIG